MYKNRLNGYGGFKGQVNALAFSPDGKTLVTGDNDQSGRTLVQKECRLWDARSGTLLRSLVLQENATSAAFSPDGEILAVGEAQCCVQLFDTESWKLLRQLSPGSQEHIRNVAWSPDGATITVAWYNHDVSIFDAKTGKIVRRIEEHPRETSTYNNSCFDWSPDGKKIGSSYKWEGFRIWEVESGTQLHRIEGYANTSVWSPRGSTLAGIRENG